jgi:hypothetical protein
MRKSTVKSGLTIISVGILAITAVTFCHELLARIFFLSSESEMRLVVFGLFWGGLFGGLGAVIAVTGFFRSSGGREVRLMPVILFLVVAVVLFFWLFYVSVEHPAPPRIRPGETITI